MCLFFFFDRLGEAERAIYHFKQSGSEADPDAMNKAKQVQIHLNKCTEAKRQRDWNTLSKETGLAIAAGADSAPLVSHSSSKVGCTIKSLVLICFFFFFSFFDEDNWLES